VLMPNSFEGDDTLTGGPPRASENCRLGHVRAPAALNRKPLHQCEQCWTWYSATSACACLTNSGSNGWSRVSSQVLPTPHNVTGPNLEPAIPAPV
jgi:hypothetical protein